MPEKYSLGKPEATLRTPVELLLDRAFEVAESNIEGINEAATELADMTNGDLSVLYTARRITLQELARNPNRKNRQVASLVRRALEVGSWPSEQWVDSPPIP